MTGYGSKTRSPLPPAVLSDAARAYVVVLHDRGTVFGPLTHTEALGFAEFLTAEVDPADVRPLHSPVTDLIGWRQHIALPAMQDRLGRRAGR